MSFSLRLAKASLDRRPGASATAAQAPDGSRFPSFARGLLIGFCSAFVVFDWALLGGATLRGFLYALQHLLTAR
jgi:hypothetical protein